VIGATVFDWLYHAARWTWHDPDGYNFISGPLADITLLGGAYAILRHHNCHAKGCWRIGRHQVAGTTFVVCRKHHPDPTPTAEQIQAIYASRRHAREEARATGVVAVHEVRQTAHEVAADVHQVAEDVHEAAEDVHEAKPPRDEAEPPRDEAEPPRDEAEPPRPRQSPTDAGGE
jgi:hypothetical protein